MIIKVRCTLCKFEFEMEVAQLPPFLKWAYCKKCLMSGKLEVIADDSKKE